MKLLTFLLASFLFFLPSLGFAATQESQAKTPTLWFSFISSADEAKLQKVDEVKDAAADAKTALPAGNAKSSADPKAAPTDGDADTQPDIGGKPVYIKDIDAMVASLVSKSPNLNPKVAKLALTAYDCAVKSNIPKKSILTIVDFSLPSSKKRLWVVDLSGPNVLFNTWVAHGEKSGKKMADKFSDKRDSLESSPGLYDTEHTYCGKHGYSLRINGLEKGFNDAAEARDVVVHGAWYVSESMIKKEGRIGRSWGCFALSKKLVRPVIEAIKDGGLIFAYTEDAPKWLAESKFLHCQVSSAS